MGSGAAPEALQAGLPSVLEADSINLAAAAMVILEDGVVTVADSGTGQGSVISPLLGNIYLHYVFDL